MWYNKSVKGKEPKKVKGKRYENKNDLWFS